MLKENNYDYARLGFNVSCRPVGRNCHSTWPIGRVFGTGQRNENWRRLLAQGFHLADIPRSLRWNTGLTASLALIDAFRLAHLTPD